MVLQKGMISSKTNEWATPQWLFDELNKEFNFTLDPCATKSNHKCEEYYTKEDDGLIFSWKDKHVFMNPPYGGVTGIWIKKAWEESKKGAIVVCLIPVRTDASFWHDIIFPYATQIRFIRGRLKFGGVKDTAPFSSGIVIFDGERRYNSSIIYYRESVCKKRLVPNVTLDSFSASNKSKVTK